MGFQQQREEDSCLFFLPFRVAGRGWGQRELTLLVLTLAQASREPPGEGGSQGQAAVGGGGPGVWGRGLPAALLGQPAKANPTGQSLERDAGVSEVGKKLAALSS